MEVKIYQKLVHGNLSDFCQDDLPETFRAWNGERLQRQVIQVGIRNIPSDQDLTHGNLW